MYQGKRATPAARRSGATTTAPRPAHSSDPPPRETPKAAAIASPSWATSGIHDTSRPRRTKAESELLHGAAQALVHAPELVERGRDRHRAHRSLRGGAHAFPSRFISHKRADRRRPGVCARRGEHKPGLAVADNLLGAAPIGHDDRKPGALRLHD